MTQQAEPTVRYSTVTADPGVRSSGPAVSIPAPRSAPPRGLAPPPMPPMPPMPPAGLAGPGPMAPPPFGPPAPSAGRSTGRVAGIVAAVAGGVVVLLVVLGLVIASLYSSAAPGTPAAPAAPSSAPASPLPATRPATGPATGTAPAARPVLAPAGKRLEAARSTLDQQLQKASDSGDVDGFRTAFATFRGDLQAYRSTLAGLSVPADQEAGRASLVTTVDAAIADCRDVANVRSAKGLSAPAGRFDGHYKTLVDTHNQLLDGLGSR